jgi:GNAT superfamily N-acetyltransferase
MINMLKSRMAYLKYVRSRIRHSPFIRVILDVLAKIGIEIDPYYLVAEGLFDDTIPHLEAGSEEYEFGFLGPEDMKAISAIPYRIFSEEQLLLRLREGKMCFGAKHRGNIAGFTWCDLDECHYKGYKSPMKKDEAYLFDAYTLDSFRGKGIAPYIRYQLYKELEKAGRKTLYSISERFNFSSIRFKKKLNARLVGQGLCVVLFKKWLFSTRLRRL